MRFPRTVEARRIVGRMNECGKPDQSSDKRDANPKNCAPSMRHNSISLYAYTAAFPQRLQSGLWRPNSRIVRSSSDRDNLFALYSQTGGTRADFWVWLVL